MQQIPKDSFYEDTVDIELPDDCGLDPTVEYSPEDLDKIFPEWRNHLGEMAEYFEEIKHGGKH